MRATQAGRNGYMDAGSEPTSLRPSQEDGTFTQGKLPQITIFIYYCITQMFVNKIINH